MCNQLEGYVVYCKDKYANIPYGVVSEDYEFKAITNYIPNYIKDILVQIEDKRFFNHKGIDIKGICRAIVENIKAGRIVQGGSTLTQQLARNLLKDNKKTILRKVQETIKAVQIENSYSKDEILNLYFNNVYFGKNIRGIRAAGLCYFGKEINKLSKPEFLYLLTILRGPNYYLKRPAIAENRFKFISNTLYQKSLISNDRNQKNQKAIFNLKNNELFSIKSASVPFITESKDDNHKKIVSTIDMRIQLLAKQFVADSKYPVSIIALRKNKVVGFASSYGTDYPFISKSNVGSTLKPFIYCHLRDNAISKNEKFNALENEMKWYVREVDYSHSKLNIQEALFHSNNNTFLNAVNKIGIEGSLEFLAKTFNRSASEFYLSSILGATKKGISLYELALAYSDFFSADNLTENKIECLSILNKIFINKLGFTIENAFLKTGTTNNNKERFAALWDRDITFAILRNENLVNDESKEGSFMKQIRIFFASYLKSNKNYKWT